MTYLSANGYRIDQQFNGAVQMGPDGDSYWQLAVQAGSNLYASVYIPAGSAVSAGGIRKALYQSLDTRYGGDLHKISQKVLEMGFGAGYCHCTDSVTQGRVSKLAEG